MFIDCIQTLWIARSYGTLAPDRSSRPWSPHHPRPGAPRRDLRVVPEAGHAAEVGLKDQLDPRVPRQMADAEPGRPVPVDVPDKDLWSSQGPTGPTDPAGWVLLLREAVCSLVQDLQHVPIRERGHNMS